MKKTGFLLLVLSTFLFARVATTFKMHHNQDADRPGPAGNGITDIVPGSNSLWIGAGGGLARYDFTADAFELFDEKENFVRGSISAVYASGDTIWIAAAIDSFFAAAEQLVSAGTGFSLSTDNGETWEHFDQPGQTPMQNVTYDMTMVDGTVWGASWGGGLLRSDDLGRTWEQVAPDTLVFNPGNQLNHRAFSCLNADGELWVGTAAGVNKSIDNGENWTNFSFYNQTEPISGDFVVALAHQKTATQSLIWAATWKAEGQDEEYGLSFTDNGGVTWKTTLEGLRVQNVAFDGNDVYAVTYDGLYKSKDFGESWFQFPSIVDSETDERVFANEYYSIHVHNGTVWVGTKDGLAKTDNNGYTWKIYRAFQQTGKNSEPRTYAYPNPFSSSRYNQFEGDGFVRLQYNVNETTQVSVKIYDFAMDLVATVCDNKDRIGPNDYNEVWNAKNDNGEQVANGVYFYSVDIDNDGTYWGKIMVVN